MQASSEAAKDPLALREKEKVLGAIAIAAFSPS